MDEIENENSTTQSDNLLTLLSELQSEIQTLRVQNGRYEMQINRYRLMMFPAEPLDVCESFERVNVDLLQLVKDDPTLERVALFHKLHLQLTAHAADLIETHRSKLSIKIKLDKDHTAGMQDAKEKRLVKTDTKGKVKLSNLDKAIAGLRSTLGGLSQKDFIKMVQASSVYKDTPEEKIVESLERLNLLAATKKVTK